MGIQHVEQVPQSFADAAASNYLGNPEVVSGLVGKFAAEVERLLSGGASSKEDFLHQSEELVRQYADIFTGRNTAYRTMLGFNSISLAARLQADLGEFWGARREKWGDDAVCVFFEWLFLNIVESVKRADGDDDLLGVMVKPYLQQAISHLMGTEVRI